MLPQEREQRFSKQRQKAEMSHVEKKCVVLLPLFPFWAVALDAGSRVAKTNRSRKIRSLTYNVSTLKTLTVVP